MIIDSYPQFGFSILPCLLAKARTLIALQLKRWNKDVILNDKMHRDVRIIYCSPDGPSKFNARNVGILLSEVDGPKGMHTLFVSSINDGYASLVTMLSRQIEGVFYSVRASSMKEVYPGNFLTVTDGGERRRVVYAMKDERSWVFFQKGDPLWFERPELYRRRLKRERMNPEILAEYIESIGYGSLDREFWSSSAPGELLREEGFRMGCQSD